MYDVDNSQLSMSLTIVLPQSTPNTAIILEFGLTKIKFKIMKKKLVDYQRIKMDEERIVKKWHRKQKNGAKNIFTEKEIIMEELGINSIEVTKMNKKLWEQVIDKKIKEKADEEARKDCYMKEKKDDSEWRKRIEEIHMGAAKWKWKNNIWSANEHD